MATTILPQTDADAFKALAAHWIRRASGTRQGLIPDFVDLAAADSVSEALADAQDANSSAELVYGAGVEFGMQLALEVFNAPLSSGGNGTLAGISQAVANAKTKLREIAEAERKDAALRECA